MRINLISESEFTVQGHGVHTAFVEMKKGLEADSRVELFVNSSKKADIVHMHTIGPYALGKLLFSSGKKVVSAHVIPESFIGSLKGAKYWKFLAKWWLGFFYGRADLVLACSNMVAKTLREEMGLKNVGVLYNAIDTTKYYFSPENRKKKREELGIADDKIVILWNGQIQPRKRFDVFVDMAKAHPDKFFIWVGGMPFKNLGADSAALAKMAENTPKNLLVTGVISLDEVKNYFMVWDIFVLPSSQENHPLAVLEASASGLPIIVRDIPEYDDTFLGHVAMAKTDADFSRLVDKILENPEYKKTLLQGSKSIAERFNTKNNNTLLLNFYQKLLNE